MALKFNYNGWKVKLRKSSRKILYQGEGKHKYDMIATGKGLIHTGFKADNNNSAIIKAKKTIDEAYTWWH